MIEKALEELGLKAQEIAVYTALASAGKATAQNLSKRLNIPRATIYWNLESLIKKGVVSLEKKKHSTFFLVNHASSFLRMVNNEKKKAIETLQRKEVAAHQVIDELKIFFGREPLSIPKLQFFEGKEGVEAMLYDYLPQWQESAFRCDCTWWGYQDPSFVKHYLKWLEHTWTVKQNDEVYKVMTNRSKEEDRLLKTAAHRNVKFIPDHIKFSSTIWVVGEYIILIMTALSPHYAFQLREPMFAANMRAIFQMLWESNSSQKP